MLAPEGDPTCLILPGDITLCGERPGSCDRRDIVSPDVADYTINYNAE
jgi:hypothetical protein